MLISHIQMTADERALRASGSTSNVIELASRRTDLDDRFSKVDDLVDRLTQDTQFALNLSPATD